MRRLLLVTLVGCGSVPTAAPTPDAAMPAVGHQPAGCAQTITLVGSVTVMSTVIGPLALDADGANICLHLDTTQVSRAHFGVDSDLRDGDSSLLAATLEHADRSAIVDAWDVTVDGTPPTTHLNLEWNPATSVDVVLWLHAAVTGTQTSSFGLALFDPLD